MIAILSALVRTDIVRSLMRPLHVASGKKWVGILGLLLQAGAAACLANADTVRDLRHGLIVCAAIGCLATFVASLSKGLADRRNPRPWNAGATEAEHLPRPSVPPGGES